MIKVRGDVYERITGKEAKLVKQIGISVITKEQLDDIKHVKESALPKNRYIEWVTV